MVFLFSRAPCRFPSRYGARIILQGRYGVMVSGECGYRPPLLVVRRTFPQTHRLTKIQKKIFTLSFSSIPRRSRPPGQAEEDRSSIQGRSASEETPVFPAACEGCADEARTAQYLNWFDVAVRVVVPVSTLVWSRIHLPSGLS